MAKKINWNKYLFRSSGLYNIMSGTVGLTESQKELLYDLRLQKDKPTGLTKKQGERLQELHEKDKITSKMELEMDSLINKAIEVSGLTPSQQATLDEYSALEKDKTLPKGVQTYLKKLYREEVFNRRKRLESKYTQKGNLMEEEAITMYSLYTMHPFHNNKERVNNKYITGEYDMYLGPDINSISEGFDTKCSFDLSTFPFPDDPLNPNYYWQAMGYMWLSGADKWTIVYCLTNTPASMVRDMIYREDFRWNNNEAPKSAKLDIINTHTYTDEAFAENMMMNDCIPDPEDTNEDNLKCAEIVNNFVPMTLEERILEKVVHRDDKVIKSIKERIDLCRKFLLTLNN